MGDMSNGTQLTCIACHKLLDLMDSCPHLDLWHERIPVQIKMFEVGMVISSVYPYLASLYVLIMVLIKRTKPRIHLFTTLLMEYVICKMIKEFTREQRPNYPCNKTYGMPSAHCAYVMGMFCWSMLCYMYKPYRKHENYDGWMVLAQLFALPPIVYSRLYLRFHTIEQILIGLNVGMLGSLVGYYLLNMRGGKSEELEREYMDIGEANKATKKALADNPQYTRAVTSTATTTTGINTTISHPSSGVTTLGTDNISLGETQATTTTAISASNKRKPKHKKKLT